MTAGFEAGDSDGSGICTGASMLMAAIAELPSSSSLPNIRGAANGGW